MARLTDPVILARYQQALADWKLDGAIELIGLAHEGLRNTLEGVTVAAFKEQLFLYVCQHNGEIDQVKEERERWRTEWEWHYDLRPTINGIRLYVETRLFPKFTSKSDPVIYVVQIKPV